MTRTQIDTTDVPARKRGRLGRSWPVLAGAVIAAGGLVFGSLTAASAAAGQVVAYRVQGLPRPGGYLAED